MSERYFRIVLGSSLLIILFFDFKVLAYVYIGIVFIEGVTNYRIPSIITRIKYGSFPNYDLVGDSRINFEAERALRILIALFLVLSYFMFAELLWFLPWFISIMLLAAGITNICPMQMSLKWLGFK